MSKAKGITIFRIVVLLYILSQSNNASAATFTVGDSGGWTFNVAGWENGKSFKAGDVLVFNYPQDAHNVVAVGKSKYDSCSSSGGTTYNSGSDSITLKKGSNYFICSIGSHCQSGGMKIAANAS